MHSICRESSSLGSFDFGQGNLHFWNTIGLTNKHKWQKQRKCASSLGLPTCQDLRLALGNERFPGEPGTAEKSHLHQKLPKRWQKLHHISHHAAFNYPPRNGFVASIEASCLLGRVENGICWGFISKILMELFFFFFPGLSGRERTGRRFGSLTAVLSHTTQKMLAV